MNLEFAIRLNRIIPETINCRTIDEFDNLILSLADPRKKDINIVIPAIDIPEKIIKEMEKRLTARNKITVQASPATLVSLYIRQFLNIKDLGFEAGVNSYRPAQFDFEDSIFSMVGLLSD